MDYKESILKDIENGFSKSDLERLIGIPKNTLSSFLSGKRTFSKKTLLKIRNWENSQKPDPLTIPKDDSIGTNLKKFIKKQKPITQAETTSRTDSKMPEGMGKLETLKWLRENG